MYSTTVESFAPDGVETGPSACGEEVGCRGHAQTGAMETREAAGLDVTIVLPCLNEILTLPDCIANARSALRQLAAAGLSGEIVIADNGSTDGSQALARELGARVVPVAARGYGNALRGGIAAAAGRYIVMGDCDGSYDFEEAVPMVHCLQQGYELCMGSRLRGRVMPGAMPWKNRHIGNPALTGILNMLFRSGLSDAHCGLRAFTREAAERLNLTSEGMEFASEMVIKAALLDLKRTEVPITLHPDRRNRPPHLRPWRDGWRHLRFLFMLSPIGLFMVPSILMSLFGAVVLGLLLGRPEGQDVVQVGPAWLGPHWLPLAGAALTLGHLLSLFAVGSELLGIRAGYRRARETIRRPVRWLLTLERSLMLGGLCLAAGLAILVGIAGGWASAGFGLLNRLPELTLATVLMTIGVQHAFGGFLLSIIAGNQSEFLPRAGSGRIWAGQGKAAE